MEDIGLHTKRGLKEAKQKQKDRKERQPQQYRVSQDDQLVCVLVLP